MSKTDDASKLDHDTLADSELDAVVGGVNWYNLPGNEKYLVVAPIAQAAAVKT